jgi:hypothetical protein
MRKMESLLTALSLLAVACLPDDTRPPPGELTVEVAVSDASREFDTDDGWRISYEAFLLGIGEVELHGDGCNPYTESDYLRLLDLRSPEPQRLNLAYALGSCDLSFRVRSPSRDVVLGEGVESSAATSLEEKGSDAFVEDAGTVLHAAGRAVRGDRELSFAWSFRRELEYPKCATVNLEGESERSLVLDARPSVLFRENADPASEALRFDPYAAADFDGDDVVTLDELGRLELEPSGGEPFGTLAERLYLGLMPAVARGPAGAFCSSRAPEDDF